MRLLCYFKLLRFIWLVPIVGLFLSQCAFFRAGRHSELIKSSRDSEFNVSQLIGYTELRTNLPGGRQSNVNTMRAMIVNSDGTNQRILKKELNQSADTSTQFAGWSPDGETAIIGRMWKNPENAKWEELHKQFRNIEGEVLYDNYLINMATRKAVNVTAVERVSHYNGGLFFWPDDAKKLGFTALIGEISHPFSMDIDGRNKKDLTKGSKDFTYGFNASRDGKKVAYHKDYQVYIANADGSDPHHIDTGASFNFGPQWSPDGAWLLFVSGTRNTSCNPYIVRSDGSGLKKLADRGGYKGSVEFLDVYDFHAGSSDIPVWSSDGKFVFYTALIGNKVELFQVGLERKAERLTYSVDGTLHYHPEPSPDGRWLLYGSKREGIRQIFVMRLSDRFEKQITNLTNGYAAMWAHWQPKAK
jgi:TolB protein